MQATAVINCSETFYTSNPNLHTCMLLDHQTPLKNISTWNQICPRNFVRFNFHFNMIVYSRAYFTIVSFMPSSLYRLRFFFVFFFQYSLQIVIMAMVIVIMFPTQPKLALAVFIAYTHHTCVSNKKKIRSQSPYEWRETSYMKPASRCLAHKLNIPFGILLNLIQLVSN